MEKFLLENSTEEQEWILNPRFQWIPYSRICQEWSFARTDGKGNKIGLTNQNVIARIRRSSLGYSWSKSTKEGSDPYLCHEVVNSLKVLIILAAKDSSPFRIEFYCITAATRLYLQPHNTNKHFFSWNWCNLQLPQRAGW